MPYNIIWTYCILHKSSEVCKKFCPLPALLDGQRRDAKTSLYALSCTGTCYHCTGGLEFFLVFVFELLFLCLSLNFCICVCLCMQRSVPPPVVCSLELLAAEELSPVNAPPMHPSPDPSLRPPR